MPNTFYPTQIGSIPTGANGQYQVSTVVIGRTISGAYDAPGFGYQGRPDYAELVQINLTQRVTVGPDTILSQLGTITLNVGDILAAMAPRAQFPTNLNLTLKEVLVCDAGTTKGMMIIGSQTYPTGSA